MGKTGAILIGIAIFVIFTFLYWILTSGYVEKVHGKKMWKQWGTRMYYWQGALFVGGGLTVVTLYFLKSSAILTF